MSEPIFICIDVDGLQSNWVRDRFLHFKDRIQADYSQIEYRAFAHAFEAWQDAGLTCI